MAISTPLTVIRGIIKGMATRRHPATNAARTVRWAMNRWEVEFTEDEMQGAARFADRLDQIATARRARRGETENPRTVTAVGGMDNT